MRHRRNQKPPPTPKGPNPWAGYSKKELMDKMVTRSCKCGCGNSFRVLPDNEQQFSCKGCEYLFLDHQKLIANPKRRR